MFGHELHNPVDLAFGALLEPDLPETPRMEYLREVQEHLWEVHKFAWQDQANAGGHQKHAYDMHCQ